MADTSFRHIHMLQLLTRTHPIPTVDIKTKLDELGYKVSLRTIQRDLAKMEVPFSLDRIERTGNKDSYWKFLNQAPVLDIAGLDPRSALTLTLMHAYLKPLVPVQTLQYLQPYLERAEAILKELGENSLGTWPAKVHVLQRGQPLMPPEVNADVQDAVYQALLEEKRFSVLYRARGRKNYHERIVHPLALVMRDQVLYLVCTIADYTDIRQLALHRMKDASVLDVPRTKPEDFDIDTYIQSGEFGRPVGEAMKVTLHFNRIDGLHLYETPLSQDQVIREIDDQTFELTATVNNTDEFRRWLLGFGAAAQVIAPRSLRDELRETVQQMLGHYAA